MNSIRVIRRRGGRRGKVTRQFNTLREALGWAWPYFQTERFLNQVADLERWISHDNAIKHGF